MKMYKKNERTSDIFSYEVNLSIERLQIIIPCLFSLFSQNLKEKDLLTVFRK